MQTRWVLSWAAILATAISPVAMGQVVGGASKVSVKDAGVVDAAKFAVAAHQKKLKEAGKVEKVTLVKIANAQQQVVQGMNYKLTLQIKSGESVQTAEAEVWARVWLKGDDQYKLTSWKFVDDKDAKPSPAKPSVKPPTNGGR